VKLVACLQDSEIITLFLQPGVLDVTPKGVAAQIPYWSNLAKPAQTLAHLGFVALMSLQTSLTLIRSTKPLRLFCNPVF
jgi:hypothetical protein